MAETAPPQVAGPGSGSAPSIPTAPSAHQQTFFAVASAVVVTIGSAITLAWVFIAGVQFESVGDIVQAQYRLAQYIYATADSDEQAREILKGSGLELSREPPSLGTPLSPIRITARSVARRVSERLGVPVEVRRDGERRVVFWIGPAPDIGGDWLALPLSYDPGNARLLILLWFAAVTTAIIVASWWLAGQINRPLQRLASATRTLARGEPLPPPRAEGPLEVRQLAAALDEADRNLREDLQERKLMLAGISHDVRTPLARMLLSVDLLKGDQDTQLAIEQDIGEINAILDRFMEYVRDGREEPFAHTDLAVLIREAAQRYRAQMPIEVEVAQHLDAQCRPQALQRLLHNLLDNAVRHGRPPIQLSCRRRGNTIELSVRDHGDGLPPTAQEQLGRRPNLSEDRRHGYGLHIVQRIAAAHGGIVKFRDARPGTRVRFIWPDPRGNPEA